MAAASVSKTTPTIGTQFVDGAMVTAVQMFNINYNLISIQLIFLVFKRSKDSVKA